MAPVVGLVGFGMFQRGFPAVGILVCVHFQCIKFTPGKDSICLDIGSISSMLITLIGHNIHHVGFPSKNIFRNVTSSYILEHPACHFLKVLKAWKHDLCCVTSKILSVPMSELQLGNCVEIGIPMLLLIIGLSQVSAFKQFLSKPLYVLIFYGCLFTWYLLLPVINLHFTVSEACETTEGFTHFWTISYIDLCVNHLDICNYTNCGWGLRQQSLYHSTQLPYRQSRSHIDCPMVSVILFSCVSGFLCCLA